MTGDQSDNPTERKKKNIEELRFTLKSHTINEKNKKISIYKRTKLEGFVTKQRKVTAVEWTVTAG